MRSFFFATCFAFVLLSTVSAQGYVDMLPDEVKNPFYARHESISKALLKPPANEWVGRYSREVGPTWSELFLWEPGNGFAAFRDTCSNGPRAWVNYGGASFVAGALIISPEREVDGALIISPEREKEAEHILEFPSNEFTPVRWGQERWLVPTNKLALFAYAINSHSGNEFEIGYVKIEDAETRRIGRPDLPLQYRQLLDLPPITTTIVEIDNKAGNRYPPMTIDVGKNRGVIEGMSFWLVGHKGVDVRITVTEVRERTSVVEVISWGLSRDFGKEIVPTRGWRFTSRVPSTD